MFLFLSDTSESSSRSFQHFKATARDLAPISDLKLPFTFCVTRQIRLRLPRDITDGEPSLWEKREEDWKFFWKSRGKEGLRKSGKAAVDGKLIVNREYCG
jgi:trafficking protein particle complex subunit 8